MPKQYQPNRLNKRISRGDSATKPTNCPHEAATQNYTPREFSRLKRLCVEKHGDEEAAEKTRVDISLNKNRTERFAEVANRNALNRKAKAHPTESLESRVRSGVATLVASTQLGSERRINENAAIGRTEPIGIERKKKLLKKHTVHQPFSFSRTGLLWSKYRVGFLVVVCSVASLLLLIDVPFLDHPRKTPASPPLPKVSKGVKQQTQKARNTQEAGRKANGQNARTKTRLEKNARSAISVTERDSSAVERWSTSNERDAVDLLIAGRLHAAYGRYCQLALKRRDQPVYRVIARALSRQIDKRRPQHPQSLNDSCRIPETE